MSKNLSPPNDLFLPFSLEGYHLSAFTIANISLALFVFVTLLVLTVYNPKLFARPVFFVMVLAHLIFQIPLAFFSPIFENSLTGYIQFAVSIHAILIISLLWVVLTSELSVQTFPPIGVRTFPDKAISSRSSFIILTLIAVLTSLYLARLSWPCTGLYALLVDPGLTLLARETSIKLVGSGVATLSYGILANVMCPLMAYICIINLKKAFAHKGYFQIFVWIGVASLAMLIVLLPGIKGNLIPTFLLMGIGALVSCKKWTNRILVMIIIMSLGLLFLSVFEGYLRERSVVSGKQYEFGICAQRLGACQEANILLDSLGNREGSLGLSKRRIEKLKGELISACGKGESIARKPETFRKQPPQGPKWRYIGPILYRAFVIPIQIASWHYQYVSEYGSPGVYAMPLAKKIIGQSIDVPNKVYLAYASIYSEGDMTSTGTSPTSFLIAYPAYFGFAGVAMTLAALLCFDFIASKIIGRVKNSLYWPAIGLIAIGCINFMLSDFFTALLSHGTAFSLMLLLVLSIIEKREL